jgi:Uncharacterized protein conserved in bacteria (DUF2188)
MHRPRYIVLSQDGEWRILRRGRRYSDAFATKTEAVVAAIGIAEKDGHAGQEAEVLVRHEDGRFLIAWMFGHDLPALDPTQPLAVPRTYR